MANSACMRVVPHLTLIVIRLYLKTTIIRFHHYHKYVCILNISFGGSVGNCHNFEEVIKEN